jgi:hypothetical protein
MMPSFLRLHSHVPTRLIVRKREIKGIEPYGRGGYMATGEPANYIEVLLVLVRTLSHGAVYQIS